MTDPQQGGPGDAPVGPGMPGARSDESDGTGWDATERDATGQGAAARTPSASRRRRRRTDRAGSGRRWGRIAAVVILFVLAVVTVVGIVGAATYLPLVTDAQRTRDELQALADKVSAIGTDVNAAAIAGLRTDLAAASADVDRLAKVARDDPLLGIARVVPPLRDQVDGARAVLDAGQLTLSAASSALDLGDRFVAIRDGSAALQPSGSPQPFGSPQPTAAAVGSSRVSQVVELMATSVSTVDSIAEDLHAAEVALAAAPADLWSPIASARDLLSSRLADIVPAIDRYRRADDLLPAMLGWDAPMRYLVLNQSPGELRPTGGYTGSIGLVEFDKGRLSSMAFHDVYDLDALNDFPCIAPPPALAGHLLGAACWELADANWSPDFPTSAKDALRLYTNESHDASIDGVIGLTTYAIDELLKVTGPVTVPGTDVTIASGETTFKALENTREATSPDVNRKAFLGVFAGALFQRVLDLPASKWPELADALGRIARQREAAAWLADPQAQEFVTEWGFDGAVRHDTGDYLYAVDSNVAPVSKLNFVTDRTLTDAVTIDQYGNAGHDLTITWNNRVEAPENAAFRAIPTLTQTMLGMYTRILAPWRSRVEGVSGGSFVKLTAPETIGEEVGRTWWANYLEVPPGETTLTYRWTAPYAADFDGQNGVYILTVQKQPGRPADTLDLSITVPPGATIVETTGGLQVTGRTATLRAALVEDLVVAIRYVMAP
ncbi:MAG: DUF4012 domain-containing protein [Chloroflexota bacterium]